MGTSLTVTLFFKRSFDQLFVFSMTDHSPVKQEVSEVKDIAYKTFEVAAALRYRSRKKKIHISSEKSQVDTREGIEKVDAAYDTLVAGGHSLSQTLKRFNVDVCFLAGWPHCCQKCKSHYIRFDGYIIELETTQRQCLNAEKVQQYAVYLLLEIVHKYY